MNDSRRRFAANACLYRSLAAREPRLFLQRNLNTVLDAHQQRLLEVTTATTDGPVALALASAREAMIANERWKAGWDFPTREMLDDLTKGLRPVLGIEGMRLRLLGSKGDGGGEGGDGRQVRSPNDVGLDWLPGPDLAFRLPCQILVTVLDSRTSSKREAFRVARRCVVSQHVDDGDEASFDVELAEPIRIELDQLLVETESGTNGFRHWKRTMTAKYSLEVTIHCQDSDQSAELLSRLHSRPADDFKGGLARDGRIKAVWEDLPSCPPTGRLLPLKRTQGHKSVELKYGMDISMGWSRRRDTPLERYNRSRDMQNHQLLTPSSSDVQVSGVVKGKQHVVRYVRQMGVETWSMVQEDLKCIFCARRGGPADTYNSKSALKDPATTLDRLLLHYWSCHSFYEWEKVASPESSRAEQEPVTIEIRPKKRQIAIPISSDTPKEEYNWIAPNRPFDIKAHLAGDERWTDGCHSKSGDSRARRGAPRPPQPEPRAAAPAIRPKDVAILPPRKRQKFAMPVDSDVTFYHSSSKAPVRPGELLSESEDGDGVDDRLVQSQRWLLKQHGLSAGAVAFHEAFHRHLDIEQPAGRAGRRDAVIRFAKKQMIVDRSPEWLGAFQEKLALLLRHGVIDRETMVYCLGLIDVEYVAPGAAKGGVGGKAAEGVGGGDGDTVMKDVGLHEKPQNDTRRTNGKAAERLIPPPIKKRKKHSNGSVMTNGSDQTKRRHPSSDPITPAMSHACICGKRAESGRGSIACDNPHCARGNFHLACVGLERREVGWWCEECSAGKI
ncbi:hypothetical protein LTR91_010660 [Friedmanniomyces endolithicus]|uniref:Zinc finger PHD-type domain-containing protein n=1 Tax=Friedmanniomyces endolithicus TaxID=329885 RepID=A0AAN6FJA5_9PEZI|nr:hypothetical protein LTR35_015090 [Friedmanniomyces endolithicus]KAK0286494.1 hypothetical protein LTS00_010432 [Friedmanniomyces endolithicus]KAK0303516.1 hypothetical protein LTR01_008071 [Friedmanniomyces endolithicus]KAK0317207.1 hypothetical protein LTR82_011808 [Friedmanniomyces endolithicus]KAK0824076.1 hypothetical protein LTR73_007943 [Friedmanniomyces endolithicus]